MSSQFVHRNAEVFEKPDDFIPERWMGDDGQRLDKWLVNFSKGPRQCLGREYVYLLCNIWSERTNLCLSGSPGQSCTSASRTYTADST